ncbi:MAG: cytochrome c [Candidatus Hydrogenedentes bacterium]|nr:cytochrome c [Candidatus Hydrogenedentota bacterium]
MSYFSGKAQFRWGRGGAFMACCVGAGLFAPWVSAQAVPGVPAESTPATVAAEAAPEAVAPVDAAAAAYAMKCMGCHTIGGGVLSGPDLKNAATYPRQTVLDGIKRMEKNVGPISEEDLTMLADFLLAPDAAARIDAHRQQVQLREAASMAPPNAELGRALFTGRTAFANGGAACAACHQAGGRGGNLAVSLEDAFTRLGAQPLQATTEAPGFPVMRAIYTPLPVTKQEAMHVVKYLEEVSATPAPPARLPMHLAGIGGTALVLVLLGKSTAKRVAGTRARMVADACRRSDQGANRRRKN